jgi:membrane-bound ClpP family serine protease
LSVKKTCSTYLVLAIHDIAAAAETTAGPAHGTVVPPAGTPLSIRTITRHVAGVAADTTDDVGREVLLLRTVVLSVSDLAAILACLVLIIAQGAVQGSELAQLVALELVLALGNRRSLESSSARVRLGIEE